MRNIGGLLLARVTLMTLAVLMLGSLIRLIPLRVAEASPRSVPRFNRCPLVRPAPSPQTPGPRLLRPQQEMRQVRAWIDDRELRDIVEDLLGEEMHHYAVVIHDLQSGTGVEINADIVFYAASLFKLPIMVEAYRQRGLGLVSFDDLVTATIFDLEEDLGTFPGDVGDVYSVDDLLEMMITLSDNTSAIMLMRLLGSEVIDETILALGLTETSVFNEELPTTARDMSLLMTLIALGDAVDLPSSREMQDRLLRQTWRHRIPQGLPDGILVGNKTGDWFDAAHDVAIVYAPSGNYVLAVLSDGGGSDLLITELSEKVYGYYQICRTAAPGAVR